MSRRPDLSKLSLSELMAEVAQRRGSSCMGDLKRLDLSCHEAGSEFGLAAYQAALDHLSKNQSSEPAPCPGCSQSVAVRSHNRPREVWCVDGIASLHRDYYYCAQCRRGFYPLDIELGLPQQGRLSRELERRLADFALCDSFREGAERFSLHYRLNVSEKLFRDVADRVGRKTETCEDAALDFCASPPPPPPRKTDAPDTLVVQTDGCLLPMRGPVGWKEAKLATLYRQSHHVSHRESESNRGTVYQTRYAGVLGPQDEFWERLDTALRMERAGAGAHVVWIADGAKGNWTLAEELAPEATQILDWYHALEHASDCAKSLFGEGNPLAELWCDSIARRLMSDEVAVVLTELEQCLFGTRGSTRDALLSLHRYYQRNAHRMLYGTYLRRSFPIGSGKVESAHRHVLQRRMKNAGQHWSVPRARRMVRMRCLYQTTGPDRFYATVHRALRLTDTGKIPQLRKRKRALASS